MSVAFRLRDFCYPLALLRLRASFARSQWFTAERLRAHQDERLRATIAHAYHHVPYYHDLFQRLRLMPADVRTVADLTRLPLLSKETLRAEFPRLQARDARRYHPQVYQTSGTSGVPVRFLLDKPANVLEFVYYWRHWSWAGYRLGRRFAELSSAFFLRSEELARRPYHYQRAYGRLLLNSLSFSPDTIDTYARALYEYRPRFLKGTASALYFFALFLRERGLRAPAMQGVFSTGEMLLEGQRRLIEEVFGGKVYDSYGHMERTVAVSECPCGGLHINPEYGVLELVDRQPLHTPADDTRRHVYRARVVGTSLHNRAMPLLRYDVGDWVEVEEPAAPCSCGRAMPRVHRILGRREDVIATPDGRVVPTLFIVFDQVPGVSLGQVAQEEPDRLVARVVRGPEYTADSEAELLRLLRRFVGPAMQVTIEYPSGEALRRRTAGKFRTVVAHSVSNSNAGELVEVSRP